MVDNLTVPVPQSKNVGVIISSPRCEEEGVLMPGGRKMIMGLRKSGSSEVRLI